MVNVRGESAPFSKAGVGVGWISEGWIKATLVVLSCLCADTSSSSQVTQLLSLWVIRRTLLSDDSRESSTVEPLGGVFVKTSLRTAWGLAAGWLVF